MKSVWRKIRRGAKDEDGAVLILAAVLMVILVGCAALALDFANVYKKKSELQTAVDVSARAASRILVDGSLDGKSDGDRDAVLEQKIEYYLKKNGFPRTSLSKCSIHVDVTKGISIDAEYNVGMNFARVFDIDSIKVSAATTAVTEVNMVEGKKMTADVVFVLDISGSMYWIGNGYNIDKSNERLIPMINTVNEAIDTLIKDNPETRVSVVVFGGTNSNQVGNQKCIMKLQKNPKKINSVKVGNNTEWLTPGYIAYKLVKQYNNYGQRTGTKVIITGGSDCVVQTIAATYTQMGIYLGCKELMKADFTDDDKETAYDVKRTPAVFVMTDGEANLCNTKYWQDPLGGRTDGDGTSGMNDEQFANCGYYTILTARYWKQKIKEKYTNRNGEETKPYFYTLGFELDNGGTQAMKDYRRSVLDPVTIVNKNTSIVRKMKNKFAAAHITDYAYNDVYYNASGANDLKKGLKQFAADVIESTRSYNTRLTR